MEFAVQHFAQVIQVIMLLPQIQQHFQNTSKADFELLQTLVV